MAGATGLAPPVLQPIVDLVAFVTCIQLFDHFSPVQFSPWTNPQFNPESSVQLLKVPDYFITGKQLRKFPGERVGRATQMRSKAGIQLTVFSHFTVILFITVFFISIFLMVRQMLTTSPEHCSYEDKYQSL